MNIESWKQFIGDSYEASITFLSSHQFQTQLIVIASCVALTVLLTQFTRLFFRPPKTDSSKRRALSNQIYHQSTPYLYPVLLILALSIGERFVQIAEQKSWLISIIQTLAVLILVNRFLSRNVQTVWKRKTAQALILPLVLLLFMGWLDDTSGFLETFKLSVGNITLTLNGLLKTAVFGILLYWLGKASNVKGQTFIRSQKGLDLRSKEVFAKLFEIGLYLIICFLMLEIIGIDLTTLAIFGGALGIGLGFGLQSIASNFISGLILLLDRSLSVGDHIELEDGQQGIVRVLNMRSATIETYDGKDVLVPNEKFISSTFINWTHQNTKQRYAIELQVAYDTDLHFLFDLLRTTVSSHPKVLSGEDYTLEEQPDAEIASFGDSGVNILIEFWMDGIDDGKNRVGADLLLLIWDAFKKHDIQIPFPQREVNVLNKGKISRVDT